MDPFTALILGIVEGVSEFLPISSTGHLILACHLLGLEHTEFLKSFEISIQLGAILSVVFLYRRTLLVDRETLKRVIVAFIPTGILGLVFYRTIKQHLLGNPAIVLWALLLGGVFLILFEAWHRRRKETIETPGQMTIIQAVIIGLFQSVAMIPGVSRSASTIIGGLFLGMRRRAIVEFSFLLAVPTMLSATVYDLYRHGAGISPDQWYFLVIGFVSSFIVALLSIKFLLRFIQTHTFIPFGIYRILFVLLWVLSV
ncbi:MAG: undecaprenyl-diphosphate phosphatase [Syntrophales bacterium]|nr:undecaprenyl-diphosphate phosphatase [Syntrophales bacterium]MDD5532453.1 undecaprenyl-diphosphate phosphatase [Syntrophales bacterium]HPL62405.1 undecaprenyl-diphosphate phosphatase [Syntrophales bacterium]